MLLEMKGCRVFESVNSKEAVETASAHCSEIDLILMNLRMPVMTGVEAARLTHARCEACRVPAVAISARCEGDWRDEALAVGAVDYFSKPIGPGLIDEILGRYTV